MKKTIISFCVLLGMVAMVRAWPGGDTTIPGQDANQYRCLGSGTSAQIDTGGGALFSLCNSTGDGLQYVVLYDTVATNSVTPALLEAFRMTPSVTYSSTTFIGTGVIQPTNGVMSFKPAGIRYSRGLFIYKTSDQAGAAFVSTVEFK